MGQSLLCLVPLNKLWTVQTLMLVFRSSTSSMTGATKMTWSCYTCRLCCSIHAGCTVSEDLAGTCIACLHQLPSIYTTKQCCRHFHCLQAAMGAMPWTTFQIQHQEIEYVTMQDVSLHFTISIALSIIQGLVVGAGPCSTFAHLQEQSFHCDNAYTDWQEEIGCVQLQRPRQVQSCEDYLGGQLPSCT